MKLRAPCGHRTEFKRKPDVSDGAQYREILLYSRLVELDGRKKQVRRIRGKMALLRVLRSRRRSGILPRFSGIARI